MEMGVPMMTRHEATRIGRELQERVQEKARTYALLLDGRRPVVVPPSGPKFDAACFRYPGALVGIYDHRAPLSAIVEDVLACYAALPMKIPTLGEFLKARQREENGE
jgi:hypothetical protein